MRASSYIDKNRRLQRMDPRIKIYYTFLLIGSIFLTRNIKIIASLSLFMIILSFYSSGYKATLKSLKSLSFIIFIIFLFSPLTYMNEKDMIFNIVSKKALYEAIFLSLRFIYISFTSIILFQSTRIEDIIAALRYFKFPYYFALMLSLAFRYIPYIFNITEQVSKSYELRFSKGKRLSLLKAKLITSIILSIESAIKISIYLKQRGFNKKSTSYIRFKRHFSNIILFLLSPLFPYLIYKLNFLI